jgi:hypothetical protein
MKEQSPIDNAIELSKEIKKLLNAQVCPIGCESRETIGNPELDIISYSVGMTPSYGTKKCSKGIYFKDCQKYKDRGNSMVNSAISNLDKVKF